MKFTILRNDLATALSTVLGAIDTRQTMQILAHVLIETTADGLVLTGTNLQIELQAEAKATINTEGRATVPARKLYDIVRNLPEGAEIKIEFEEAKALVRCGRSRLSIPAMPADEYPRIDDRMLDKGVSFAIAEGELKRLMQYVAFQMPANDPRIYLNGLFLHVTNGELRAIAGGGLKMGMASMKCDALAGLESEIIIPTKSAQEVMKLLADSDALAAVRMTKSQFEIRCNAGTVKLMAIDSRYVDYMRVMAINHISTLTVGRDALKRSLARLTLVSNEVSRGVRMSLHPDSVTLETQASQAEDGEDHIDAKFDGPDGFEIGFSAVALSDVVGAITDDELVIRFVDGTTPPHISAANGSGGQHVLAPMKL